MADTDTVLFNLAAFLSALFLLQYGADKFLHHTAIVARRIGVSQAVIALLTAGAEWEELAVVIAALVHRRPSLALGNVIGSAISNILGAFSLGLLLVSGEVEFVFDKSSRLYSLVLLCVTTGIAPILLFAHGNVAAGFAGFLVIIFILYVGSAAVAISHGLISAPDPLPSTANDSDWETESDLESHQEDHHGESPSDFRADFMATSSRDPDSLTPLLPAPTTALIPPHHHKHSLPYHVLILLLGLLATCLSGYTLAHSAATLATSLRLPDALFGIVFLALATTLPEKLIAIAAARRGHVGILLANAVGSNVFLLSLCLGVIIGDPVNADGMRDVKLAELLVLWAATLLLAGVVWLGARWRRPVGAVMLVGYVVFLVLEFTVIRKL